MTEVTLTAACGALPVFPLPRVVLMPGGLLPLHVFEPRYRRLVDHCLAGTSIMGIATLKPGFEAEYHASPPVYSDAGIGRIVAHEPYPDGRCNIVLEYVGRARMQQELRTHHPFRVFESDLVREDETGAAEAARRLRVLILQLGALSDEAAVEARRLADLSSIAMVDALARRLLEAPSERLAYLRAERVAERIHMVQQRLADFLVVDRTADA